MAAQPSQPIDSSSTILDPYETLGLSHDATSTQIKIAYRKLALKYHPDRCQSPTQQNSTNNSSSADGGSISQQQYSATNSNNNNNNKNDETTLKEATDKFAKIAAAYATLSDTTKKKEYDHLYKLGAFDINQDDSINGGGAQGTSNNTSKGRTQTNNYRYTENLSGGYYKPGYKPPPPQSTNTTHPFAGMAANFTPAQQRASFAKQAEAAFTSMQSQDSFFDDLLYSPRSRPQPQHHEENTTEETANGDTTNNNSKANHSTTQKKKKQTGIGYSFKPIGKHLSIHVPSRNEIMLNMTQAQMSNMMSGNNNKSDNGGGRDGGIGGGLGKGAEKHLFGTRVTFSENKTSSGGIQSSLANMASCGLAASCVPSSTCGGDTSTPTNTNNNNYNNNSGIKPGKEKKVISTTTRIAKGQKRIVKRTAHLYPNGTKEIVIEENGVVVRRYVEENPNALNNTNNNGENVNGENGSGENQRDDNETSIPKTPPKPTKAEEEEEDNKTNGGLQKEEKFTLLGLFKACYSPCSASG